MKRALLSSLLLSGVAFLVIPVLQPAVARAAQQNRVTPGEFLIDPPT